MLSIRLSETRRVAVVPACLDSPPLMLTSDASTSTFHAYNDLTNSPYTCRRLAAMPYEPTPPAHDTHLLQHPLPPYHASHFSVPIKSLQYNDPFASDTLYLLYLQSPFMYKPPAPLTLTTIIQSHLHRSLDEERWHWEWTLRT